MSIPQKDRKLLNEVRNVMQLRDQRFRSKFFRGLGKRMGNNCCFLLAPTKANTEQTVVLGGIRQADWHDVLLQIKVLWQLGGQ